MLFSFISFLISTTSYLHTTLCLKPFYLMVERFQVFYALCSAKRARCPCYTESCSGGEVWSSIWMCCLRQRADGWRNAACGGSLRRRAGAENAADFLSSTRRRLCRAGCGLAGADARAAASSCRTGVVHGRLSAENGTLRGCVHCTAWSRPRSPDWRRR